MESVFGKLLSISMWSWLFVGVLVIGAVLLLIISSRKQWNAQSIAYGAICVTLAFLLSFIRLWRMPQGGSLTAASMLPLFMFATLFGGKRGMLCGFVYGLLQMLQDFYMVHPMQLVFDYVLAFSLLGLAGFFPKRLWLGALVGGTARMVCHIVSGALFFAALYAPEQNPWAYSIGYNVPVIGMDLLVCVVIAALPPLTRVVENTRKRLEMRSKTA